MRLLLWLLLAAFLPLVAVCPPIAYALNDALVLMLAGIGHLLAQPAVLGVALAALIYTAFRSRPRAAT